MKVKFRQDQQNLIAETDNFMSWVRKDQLNPNGNVEMVPQEFLFHQINNVKHGYEAGRNTGIAIGGLAAALIFGAVSLFRR